METTTPPAGESEPAHAKLNLSLVVLPPDGSGYHPLHSLFCALELHDEVTLRPASALSLNVNGCAIPGEIAENLVLRAARVFFDATGMRANVAIELAKRIPVGGGLGGGSSDAAATLRALNRTTDSPLDPTELLSLGATLGSDVPFFLCGSSLALAAGRGESLTPLAPLPPRHVVLVDTGLHVGTREAFDWLDQARSGAATPPAASPPAAPPAVPGGWHDVVAAAHNDFEPVVYERHPILRRVRDVLREQNALVAMLTGSGACVFGLFTERADADDAAAALQRAIPAANILHTRTAVR